MYALLNDFVAELRTVGVPISTTELIDSADALRNVDVLDRRQLRIALQISLIKHAEHLPAFATLFDLYFSSVSETGSARRRSLADMDDTELRNALVENLIRRDQTMLRAVVSELVDRHARFEAGRQVAGRSYITNVLAAVGVPELLSDVTGPAPENESAPLAIARADRAKRAVALLSELVEREVRARLARDQGAAEVARLTRVTLPESVDFANASRRELEQIGVLIAPLARAIAARTARRISTKRRGPLDFRRTIRLSMSTAGTPLEIRHRARRPPRPHLAVLADVSGSVSAFAKFTLLLVAALHSHIHRTRTFAFIDGLVEVTDVLTTAGSPQAAWNGVLASPGLIRLEGRSDYGHAFESFAASVLPQLNSRTTVLVLGDGRNNFLASGSWALHEVARKVERIYWLNPEARSNWDSGDSLIDEYARSCTEVVECRNLEQLRAFVDRLTG